MTHEQLIKEVRTLYLNARNITAFPIFNDQINSTVQRCTSHSISSEFEDLVAQYCCELVNDPSVKIYIDPQMKFPELLSKNKSGKKALIYRPDIILVKGEEIVAMIDAKTDLGFKKNNYLSYFQDVNGIINNIAGQKSAFKVSTEGETLTVSISKHVNLIFFVAAHKYFTKKKYIKEKEIENLERIKVFFLSKGGGAHLNNYKNEEAILNVESMNAFDSYIRDTIR